MRDIIFPKTPCCVCVRGCLTAKSSVVPLSLWKVQETFLQEPQHTCGSEDTTYTWCCGEEEEGGEGEDEEERKSREERKRTRSGRGRMRRKRKRKEERERKRRR